MCEDLDLNPSITKKKKKRVLRIIFVIIIIYFYFEAVLGIKPRVLHMLGKLCTTELHPHSQPYSEHFRQALYHLSHILSPPILSNLETKPHLILISIQEIGIILIL